MEIIPAVAWAIFLLTSPTGTDYVLEAYARIMME